MKVALISSSRPVKMKELCSILVYLTLFILPNTRRTGGSNAEETSERYKIEGKITIQGFKPSGKNLFYNSADLYVSLHVDSQSVLFYML